MKKLQLSLVSLIIATTAMAQIPSLIEVSEENWEAWYGSDFNNVLNFVAQGADTVLLTTSGFLYSSSDTLGMVIDHPVVIMAAPGLAEKPIITHTNPNASTSMEIFRVCTDVVFDGIAFEGNVSGENGCKYGIRYGDYENEATGAITLAGNDINITIKN